MNINIKATKTTLTPSIKRFIQDKLDIISKFIREEDKIHVEVEADKKHNSGLVFRAEILIHPHGYYADARGEDFYSAMDAATLKIKEQLAKAKDKKVSQRRERQKRA